MAYSSDVLNDFGQVPDGIADPVLYTELLAIHDAIEKLAAALEVLTQRVDAL